MSRSDAPRTDRKEEALFFGGEHTTSVLSPEPGSHRKQLSAHVQRMSVWSATIYHMVMHPWYQLILCVWPHAAGGGIGQASGPAILVHLM